MSECIRPQPVPACFTPTNPANAPVTLLAHVLYQNGVSIGQAFTTMEDTETVLDLTTHLGGGTVSPGACPIASPDVEWCKMCDDVNGDGTEITEFFRRTITSFDATNTASTSVADFGLDKTTAYTISAAANVSVCNEDCDLVGSQGTLTAWVYT